MGYTEEELNQLNQLAQEIFGMDYEDLDPEDQDYIYCEMEER